jgi:hypothetical protein
MSTRVGVAGGGEWEMIRAGGKSFEEFDREIRDGVADDVVKA